MIMQWMMISSDMLNHRSVIGHGETRLHQFHFKKLKLLIIRYEESILWPGLSGDQKCI